MGIKKINLIELQQKIYLIDHEYKQERRGKTFF